MSEQKRLTISEKIRKWYKELPESKKYFEFISTILAIPVLLTVLLLNYSNLQKKEDNISPTPAVKNNVTIIPVTVDKSTSPAPTSVPECKKEVGPVEITSPTENQTITQQPVCFTINYRDNNYCSVVWSYKIDGGPASDFTDKSVCLYNLTSGAHKFELTVKSIVSSDQTNLVRNFDYEGQAPTQTVTPTVSPSPIP